MALIDDIKTALRISNPAFDTEISGLISAAQSDLQLAGITPDKAVSEVDPLIVRAVTTYAKTHFGFDNPDAERFQQVYDSLKMSLALSDDYNGGSTDAV